MKGFFFVDHYFFLWLIFCMNRTNQIKEAPFGNVHCKKVFAWNEPKLFNNLIQENKTLSYCLNPSVFSGQPQNFK